MSDPTDKRWTVPELIELMRTNHLIHLEVGPYKLDMSPDQWKPAPQSIAELQKAMDDVGPGLTPEEALFYSVEGGIWSEPDTGNN